MERSRLDLVALAARAPAIGQFSAEINEKAVVFEELTGLHHYDPVFDLYQRFAIGRHEFGNDVAGIIQLVVLEDVVDGHYELPDPAFRVYASYQLTWRSGDFTIVSPYRALAGEVVHLRYDRASDTLSGEFEFTENLREDPPLGVPPPDFVRTMKLRARFVNTLPTK